MKKVSAIQELLFQDLSNTNNFKQAHSYALDYASKARSQNGRLFVA